MNKSELKALVAPYVIGSTITEITEKDGFYIVYFVNNAFYATKDPLQMLVGAGPLLINKQTRKVYETGSGQIPSYCIESYYKTGDINSNPGKSLIIHSLNKSNDKTQAILLLKKLSNLNTKSAREIVDNLVANIESKIELETIEKANEVVTKLNESGFNAEQIWK